MRAVIAQDKRPIIVDIPKPTPAPHEMLVKVHATALNRADLLQVQGQYPPPEGSPDTIGMEFAGEVVELGTTANRFSIGQLVMALVGGGGYADYAVVDATHAMPIPSNMSVENAAAIPEVFLTAYSNMVEMAGLKSGETVLIHAGASGVGLAAIQIAKVIGATVIVTASAEKHAICRQYGADLTIDYKKENFADRILAENMGVDVVLELIGAPYWESNMRVLNKWGRLAFVGLMGGATKEVNFRELMLKRLSIMGSTMRNRSAERKTALVQNFWAWAEPHFESGRLQPTIWKTYPLERVADAHDAMRDNRNAGKIVLIM